jgi:hypothetical protein
MSRVSTPTAQPQPTGTRMTTPQQPTHEQICMRAYEKWVKKGRPQGTHMQDWFEAEAELKRETMTGTRR